MHESSGAGSARGRVLVAPTAFKGTLGAGEAADAMADGVRRARTAADVEVLPLSDGGPGLLDAVQTAEGGEVESARVSDPLGREVRGRVLRAPSEEVTTVESADACGLHLLSPEERAPMRVHTLGVGELVEAAAGGEAGLVRVGLGGSGTVDGGTGMARAFGFRFLGPGGRELVPGGGALRRLERIVPGRPPDPDLLALADVRNPLTGPRGAARVFAPQKGADAEQVAALEDGLRRLGERMERDLGADVGDLPGAGAAGGLGAGCVAFLGAELRLGADWVLDRTEFGSRLEGADLLVTGEGAYDVTSGEGKIVGSAMDRALEQGVSVLLVCGRIAGPVPAGVRPVDGGGAELTARDVARLVERSLGDAGC